MHHLLARALLVANNDVASWPPLEVKEHQKHLVLGGKLGFGALELEHVVAIVVYDRNAAEEHTLNTTQPQRLLLRALKWLLWV